MAIKIEQAKLEDAAKLKTMGVEAFTSDFEQYGAYPPGIESLAWHQSEIEKGHYYKILYSGKLAGGICLIPSGDELIEIKYFFISEDFQNKQFGSETMVLIEKKYNSAKVWNLFTPYKAYRNHHFYQKFGYIKVDEIQPDQNNPFKLFEYKKEAENHT